MESISRGVLDPRVRGDDNLMEDSDGTRSFARWDCFAEPVIRRAFAVACNDGLKIAWVRLFET
jgi:hypothetical protein